ncbi:hypothetical protein WK03_00210 [Burkholderia cepacia]|nr:hypothetical protein WK03_00210 [Burkholderia cepacia]
MMFEGLRIGGAVRMGRLFGEIDVLAGFAVGCRMNSTRQGPGAAECRGRNAVRVWGESPGVT